MAIRNLQKKILVYVFYLIFFIFLVAGIFYDKEIVSFISGNRISILTPIMSGISFFGAWFIVLAILTFLFLVRKKTKEIFPLWLSIFSSLIIVFILKILIARARPFEALISLADSSFPSGHAAAVFSAFPVINKKFPKLSLFWLFFSILVAFSRLYLGVHYLTDIVSGALIGYTIGLMIVKSRIS